jgi:ankyrin repeat protein
MKPDAKTPDGTTALMLAARDLAKVKLLIERGADVSARAATGVDALMVAARYRGNSDVVRLLLSRGAKPNPEKGSDVRNMATPIFLGVMAGDISTVAMLIDAGAKVGERMKILGRFMQSPVLYAVSGDSAMVELLISKGADANELDDDRIPLLSWAVIGNHPNVVQLLLSKGANVNQVDNKGMTPLLYAASIDFGDTAVLEKLMAAGAELSIRNKEGLTALDLAKNYHHPRIAELLTKKSASAGRN